MITTCKQTLQANAKGDKARKEEIDYKSLDPVSNIDAEVSKNLQMSNDCSAG